MNTASILATSVHHAVSYLSSPLLDTAYSIHAIDLLQRSLVSSLTTRYTVAGCWDSNPEVGFQGRAIRLSSSCPPPTFVSRACEASGIQWADWFYLLSGGIALDMDLFVDPGVVSVQFRKYGGVPTPLSTVWKMQTIVKPSTRELLAADDDNEIFALLNQKMDSPSWVDSWSSKQPARVSCFDLSTVSVPKIAPVPVRAPRPSYATHSRSSSASSFTSSSRSTSSASPSNSSYSLSSEDSESFLNWRSPAPKLAPAPAPQFHYPQQPRKQPQQQPFRPTHSRQNSQNSQSSSSVTAYDGGKTRVASGGVTLAAASRRY